MHSSWGVGGGFARLNVFYPPMDKEVKLDTCWYPFDRSKEGDGGEKKEGRTMIVNENLLDLS